MTPAPLDAFLAQMAALLDGRATAEEVEQALGKSPSGTQRLGLYAQLVERQQRSVVDGFYAAARVAADALAAGRFGRLRDQYLNERRPSSWRPADAAEGFGAFLSRRSVAAEVVELVDFAWTRHAVLHAVPASRASMLAVRHYTHAVREFSRDVERNGRTRGRPLLRDETWLIGRTRDRAELVVLQPSVAALVAVQVLLDRGWSAGLPEVPGPHVVGEAEHLVSLGLLEPTAPRDVAGWVPR